MRHLVGEWRLGPFELAVYRRAPAPKALPARPPRPILLDDDPTPAVPIKPIVSKEDMPP